MSTGIPMSLSSMERVRTWLSLGPGLVDAVGQNGRSVIADGLPALEGATKGAIELRTITDELLPLILTFRRRDGWQARWLHWFSGQRLEREVFFDQSRRRVEELAQRGAQARAQLRLHLRILQAQDAATLQSIEALDSDINAARLLDSEPLEAQRRAAGLLDDDMTRLRRRIANLESIVAAAHLTRGQYRVAAQNARALSDRFDELCELLVPLWKQATGVDLTFVQTSTKPEGGP